MATKAKSPHGIRKSNCPARISAAKADQNRSGSQQGLGTTTVSWIARDRPVFAPAAKVATVTRMLWLLSERAIGMVIRGSKPKINVGRFMCILANNNHHDYAQ
jgi:formate-dependent phosphoribosylglycinamide formyltransferase (GAR transformylase)